MSTFVCKITNWSYGYFIVTPIMGLREVYFPVLAKVKTGKLRQLKILKASQKSEIQFTRLSVNFHKSTRLVPTPLETPLKITEFAQIRKNS